MTFKTRSVLRSDAAPAMALEAMERRQFLTVTSATVNAPEEKLEGAGTKFELSATSADGEIVGWQIDWGDGASEWVDGNPSSVFHTYADGAAQHTVHATAYDNTSASPYYLDASPYTVDVENVAPTLDVQGGATAFVGEGYSISATHTDPGQDTIQHWDVDWGDGSDPDGDSVVGERIYGSDLAGAQHVYASEGNFAITANATDEDGTFNAAPLNVQAKFRYTIDLNATTKTAADAGTFEGTIKEGNQGVEDVDVKIKLSKQEAVDKGVVLNDSADDGQGFFVLTVKSKTLGGFNFSLHGDNLNSRTTVTLIFEVTGAKTKQDTYTLHDRP